MATGKTIALTRRTFVGKVMSQLFNMLSRLVITLLPRSKRLLISWLQSPSAVILEPPQNKVCHCFHCFPIYLPWRDGTRCLDLFFWMLSFKPTHSSQTIPKIRRGIFPSSLFESSINPDSKKTSQDNYRPVSLMNIDAEIPSEILGNKIQAICKKDTPPSHRKDHTQSQPRNARLV